MIEVNIDLVPLGQDLGRKILGTIYITNTGEGGGEFGNYIYTILDQDGVLSKGEIKGFQRDEGVFALVQKILENAPLDRAGDKT